MAATDVTVAAADASAAAAVAREAVMLIAADPVRGAAKPTAVGDDEADGLSLPSRLPRALPRPPRSRRAPPPRPWPPPRGFTPEARAWVQPAPPLLVLESSTQTRASPSSSGQCLSSTRTYFSPHQNQREDHLECGG